MALVKVKFLKNVTTPNGTYKTGEVIEVDADFAKMITTPVKYSDRDEMFVKAILIEPQSSAAPHETAPGMVAIPVANLTVSDMNDLGIKNIVKTPEDPEHQKYLEASGALPTEQNLKTRQNRLEKRQQAAKSSE